MAGDSRSRTVSAALQRAMDAENNAGRNGACEGSARANEGVRDKKSRLSKKKEIRTGLANRDLGQVVGES